jgi:hypothetical protein
MEVAEAGVESIAVDRVTEQLALVTVSANVKLIAQIKETVN